MPKPKVTPHTSVEPLTEDEASIVAIVRHLGLSLQDATERLEKAPEPAAESKPEHSFLESMKDPLQLNCLAFAEAWRRRRDLRNDLSEFQLCDASRESLAAAIEREVDTAFSAGVELVREVCRVHGFQVVLPTREDD